MSERDTIDVSSTITTSCGSRLPRSWRKRLWLSGRQPSSRCSVEARRPSRLGADRVADVEASACSWTASSSRAAALPVGAASATSGCGAPAAGACSARSATIRATVVVLPVPGPPATTVKPPRTADAHARACRPSRSAPNSRAKPACRSASSTRPPARRARRAQVRGDVALLAPVAVEVQRAADEPQRPARPSASSPTATSGLAATRCDPVARARATAARRRRRSSSSSTTVAVVAGRREVDVDVAEPRPADGERGGQRDLARPPRRPARRAARRRARRPRSARRRR